MNKYVTILGFAGSLRKGSYNKALLRAAQELLPKDAKLVIFDLEGIPPFNQDLETAMPEIVKEFKSKISSGRCNLDCNTRIQLLDTRCSQKCH